MADEEKFKYRPINPQYLSRARGLSFSIYYKTVAFGNTNYVLFASKDNPHHQERFRELMEKGETNMEFYIEEEDLFKYYDHATESLKKMMTSDVVPLKEKTKKVYGVSKEIMKEFFEYNSSEKVLHASEQVMGIMEECISKNEVGFGAIAQITNKDYYTYTHSLNVGMYCMTYGVKAKMPPSDVKELGLGGMLHDVGKSKVPLEIINKNGQLTEEEFEIMKSHSPVGEGMLRGMNCYAHTVVAMAGEHHEKFGGGGYPKGKVGETIAFGARLCKIMDVYDALTTRRSYKRAMTPFDALTLMQQKMADHFDLKLLGSFIRLMGPDM